MRMTPDQKTRRALLADFGSALLLSTTACSVLTGGAFYAADAQGQWPSAPAMTSVADCGVAPGGKLLAIGWLLKASHQGMQRAVLALGVAGHAPCGTIVPTKFPPQAVVPVALGKLLLADDDQGITPFECNGERWKRGIRRILPLRPDWCSSAVFGDRIFVTCEDDIAAIDLEPNQIHWIREGIRPTCLIATSRGTLICGIQSGEVMEVSAKTGQTLRTVYRCQEDISLMAIDPCGELLGCRTRFGGVEVCSLRDGRRLWLQKAHGSVGLPLSLRPTLCGRVLGFSSDGRDLVTAASEPEWALAIWDAYTGERLQTLRGHDSQINGATYLPDGALLSWSADGTLRRWDPRRGFAQHTICIRDFLPC